MAQTDEIAPARRQRGWHAHSVTAPWGGEGSATVDPIRRIRDIEAIKRALANKPRDLTLFIVGIHFGLRGSDLLELRWDDVLTPGDEIRTHVAVKEKKTGKQRTIRVQPNAARALENWYAETVRGPFVFPSSNGRRLTIQRLHQLVNSWTQQARVRGNFGTHTLRKTFGYQLRKAGVGIEVIMRIFGHSSQAVTLRYLGIDQDETDEASLKLNL